MSSAARAAQGDKRQKKTGLSGSGRHGGVSEKVVEVVGVKRYWPGKAPTFAGGANAAEEDDGIGFAGASAAPAKSDPRLERLKGAGGGRRKAEAEVLEDGSDDYEEAARRARRRRQRAEAEVLEEPEQD